MPPLHGQDQAPQTDRFNLPLASQADQAAQAFNQQPVPQQETESSKKGNRKPWIIGGTALAGIGLSVGAFFGLKSMTDNAAREFVYGSNPTATAPAVPGEHSSDKKTYTKEELEKMTGDEFVKVDVETRLSYMLPSLYDKAVQATGWNAVNGFLTPEQREFVNNTFPTDKSSYSDQQILNQFAIDYAVSSSQTNVDTGESDLSLIMSPENARFDSSVDQMKGGGKALIYILKATGKHATPVINGQLTGVHVNHGQLIEVHNYGLNQDEYVLFDLLSTKDGQQVWQFVQAYNINDQNAQKAIQSRR